MGSAEITVLVKTETKMRTVTSHISSLIAFATILAITSSCVHENPVINYYPLPPGSLTYRVEYYYADFDTGERITYLTDTIRVAYIKDTTIQSIDYNMIGHYGDDNDLVNLRLIRKASATYFERVSWFDQDADKIRDLETESLFLNEEAETGSIISTDDGAEYTIVEKNLTMEVNGVQYSDVIKVSQRPMSADYTADRFYAPNVGLIFAKLPYPISMRYSDADWSLLPR